MAKKVTKTITSVAKKHYTEADIINPKEAQLVEFFDATSQNNIKAKNLTAEGIDNVTKGTNFKSKAEVLMAEARVNMAKAEELFTQGEALKATSIKHDEQYKAEKANFANFVNIVASVSRAFSQPWQPDYLTRHKFFKSIEPIMAF